MAAKIIEPAIVSLALCALILGSCADGKESQAGPEETAREARLRKRVVQLERQRGQTPRWVSIYDPERAWNGYTLDFFERSVPILIDMNGEIVHSWPEARVRARLRLLPNGNLLAIGLGREVVEYGWDGDLVWEYRVEEGFYPHHDVIRLGNGNTMLIKARRGEPTDDLLEVDESGRVIWEWRSAEFLADHFGDRAEEDRDITHLNSVQILPPNPWFESGDSRFRPGNVLISARNLDAVFLIDRQTNQIVWRYDVELDRQHEAMMIAAGFPGHGNILIFNNGLQNKYTDNQSSVIEVEPISGSVVWEYRAEGFFSPIVGVQQLLPNGNVLIGSSLGPRNFEVTRDGSIVWQWTPPFKTKRPSRYPYDYCPQMAVLQERPEIPVVPEMDYQHIDRLVYRFARNKERQDVELDGQMRNILLAKSSCREILLPAGGRARLTFGVDRTGLVESGLAEFEATFTASLKIAGDPQELRSISTAVGSGDESWRSQQWKLDELAFQRVELCLQEPEILSAARQVASTHAYWGGPRITGSTDRAIRRSQREVGRDELTPEEIEVRQEHLKTLGYID